MQEQRKERAREAEALAKERKEKADQRKKDELDQKLRILAESNPYQEEITLATQLLNYCEKNKL